MSHCQPCGQMRQMVSGVRPSEVGGIEHEKEVEAEEADADAAESGSRATIKMKDPMLPSK